MACLLDSSVLGRLANRSDRQHAVAVSAVISLHRQSELLYLTPQVMIEFRSVATRPVEANGLGLGPADAEELAAGYEDRFALLEDTPGIYLAWKAVVHALEVIGKQVHDARLVAVCHAYAIPRLMTFNTRHFTRFANFGPRIEVVDPRSC